MATPEAAIQKLRHWISSQHTGLCKMLSKGDDCDCPLCCLDEIADGLVAQDWRTSDSPEAAIERAKFEKEQGQ